MSLLSQLQQKKATLKPTETIVTREDGRVFLETNSILTPLDTRTAGFITDTAPDDTPAKINENLFLGSQDCCDLNVLTNHNIKYVLSLGIPAPVTFPDINYKFVLITDLDTSNLAEHLPDCLNFIGQALKNNSNILVHCNAGVSRSSSIVIAYLIIKQRMSFESAYEIVKRARPCIKPNSGFMQQLKSLSTNTHSS